MRLLTLLLWYLGKKTQEKQNLVAFDDCSSQSDLQREMSGIINI